jgi:hypothetical protein
MKILLLLLLIATVMVACTTEEEANPIVNELPDVGLDTEVFFIEEGVLEGYAIYITYSGITDPCSNSYCYSYFITSYLNGEKGFYRTSTFRTERTTDQLWGIATETALEDHLQKEGGDLTLSVDDQVSYRIEIVTYPTQGNFIYNMYFSPTPLSRSRIRYHKSIQSDLTIEETAMQVLQEFVDSYEND